MARPRKTWGQLSKATRDRYARQASARFGLTRAQVRGRYNRGTYNPGSKNPARNVPREYRTRAQGGTLQPSPQALPLPPGPVDWKRQAYDNIVWQLGDYQRPADNITVEFNADAIWDRLADGNEADWRKLAAADAETLRDWAAFQPTAAGQPDPASPRWLWVRKGNTWYNLAWYH